MHRRGRLLRVEETQTMKANDFDPRNLASTAVLYAEKRDIERKEGRIIK